MTRDLPGGLSLGPYQLHKALHGMGHFARLVQQFSEESSELSTGLSHYQRGRADFGSSDALAEVADTILCASYIAYFFGHSWTDVLGSMKAKEERMAGALQREIDRIKASGDGETCPVCCSPIFETAIVAGHGTAMRCVWCGTIHHTGELGDE